jgi:predicted permease
MKLTESIRFRIAALFGVSHPDAEPNSEPDTELDEELRSHIQHRADDLERSGLRRAEAERRARVEFGGYIHYEQESRSAIGGNFLESLAQDVRFSLRKLRKSPGFTIAAILTLALAIGANSVVFSVMNAFLLRPLNVPDAQSLYELQHANEASAYESYPDYVDLRDRNHSFDGLAAWTVSLVGLDTGNNPTRSWIEEASGNYFDVLRIQPYLGRFFHASDEHGPNSAPYIVLNYAFWQDHFQADRAVIGRTVQLNKHSFTIIGVAPPGFHGPLLFFNPDFFTPLVNHPQLATNDLNDRGDSWVFMTLGHLKPGVTRAQAEADLNSIGSYLEKTYPKEERKMTFSLASPTLYGDYLGGPVKAFMAGMMLLSGLILLAACANLGSLFAARAADRSREVALRLALGSSRKRILRGLFTEAALISLAGGAVGLSGSVVLLSAMSAWQPIPRWPLHLSVNPDAKVYVVALLLALVSGFLFGAVPVRQVLHTNPYEVVKAGSNSKTGRRMTLRDILLVVQIAICGVLVTSSMVAVRGLVRSLHANFGFDLQNTMLIDTDPTMAGYLGDQVAPIQKRMIEALQAIPGVETVALADTVPMGDGAASAKVFTDKTSDLRPSNAAADASTYNVSPQYFRAAGTVLLSGREFTWHDDKSSPHVAVINREFALKVFGSIKNAIGSYYKMKDGTRILVVGVAEDGKYGSVTEDPQSVMFLPILQWPNSSTWLLVRPDPNSGHDPQQLGSAIRRKLHNLDEGLPVYIQSWYQQLDVALFGPRIATIALGVLGAMGAMLSITGIFGMAAYSVSKRLRELGIRMALGAQRKEVLRAALGRPLKLLLVGSAAGLLLGILAGRVLAFIVYEATPRDPLVLAGVVLAMAFLGLLATWVPAQRALSVNPLILLRED